MDPGAKRITILPLGDVAALPLARICVALGEAFAVTPELIASQLLPNAAWMPSRGQYDSTQILLTLAASPPECEGKVLAVCDVDLCTPILTCVFGAAEVEGRFAIVSLHRLRPEAYGLPADADLFLKRCAKEAIHEIGHTCGLKHCFRYSCIMHPSSSVEETDLKRHSFCPQCLELLALAGWC